MLKNTIQHVLYHRQQTINEITNFTIFFKKIVYLIVPFGIVELIRQKFFYNTEFFLSFMFWAVVILLIVYWMPTKKEYKAWVKNNHAT